MFWARQVQSTVPVEHLRYSLEAKIVLNALQGTTVNHQILASVHEVPIYTRLLREDSL